MDAISYTTAKANLVHTIICVSADHEPLIITLNVEASVVMKSLNDFKALEEKAYLLRSPRNSRRLMDAINSLNAGGGQEHALAE
jgi:antitoxin YefM